MDPDKAAHCGKPYWNLRCLQIRVLALYVFEQLINPYQMKAVVLRDHSVDLVLIL